MFSDCLIPEPYTYPACLLKCERKRRDQHIIFIHFYKHIQVTGPNLQAYMLLNFFATLGALQLTNWADRICDDSDERQRSIVIIKCGSLLQNITFLLCQPLRTSIHLLIRQLISSPNLSREMVKELPSLPWTSQHCSDVHSPTCFIRIYHYINCKNEPQIMN